MYQIFREQLLPCSLDEAWDFFSTPRNLDKITPDSVGFKIILCNSDKMHIGQLIGYKVKIAPFIWVDWLTEITHVEDKKCFVDDQRIGPYSVWHHTHRFTEVDGGVLMSDDVTYAIPMGICGKLAYHVYVKKQVEHIFDSRRAEIDKIFSPS